MSEKIRVLLDEETVEKRICEVAAQISEAYKGKEIHMICVLKGGVFFMCELAKRITVPVTLDFMSVSSYGDDTKSSGVVKIVKDLDQPLEDKEVLVVEDIIDSGRTLSYLLDVLKRRNPNSVRLCTLLDSSVPCLTSRTAEWLRALMWITAASIFRMSLLWAMVLTMPRNTEICHTSVW